MGATAAEPVSMDLIRSTVRAAAEGTPIVRVYLFGSRARGDNGDNNDVDLCVEAGPSFSLIDAGLFADAAEGGSRTPVDVVGDRFMTPGTRRNIERDRVLVYER